jgi:hypothetical protein
MVSGTSVRGATVVKRLQRVRHDDALASDRRSFLKRAGVTGAIAAALVGGAEVTGLSSAMAATKHGSKSSGPDLGCCVKCTYTPYKCKNGAACPSGQCCFHCVCNSPSCCSPYYSCISGHCSTFTEC